MNLATLEPRPRVNAVAEPCPVCGGGVHSWERWAHLRACIAIDVELDKEQRTWKDHSLNPKRFGFIRPPNPEADL